MNQNRINELAIVELDRKLRTVGPNTTFCIIDAPEGPCYYAQDIDLLRDLVRFYKEQTLLR